MAAEPAIATHREWSLPHVWVGRSLWPKYWLRCCKTIFGALARRSGAVAVNGEEGVKSDFESKQQTRYTYAHSRARTPHRADCLCRCYCPQCTAVSLITRVSRAKTSLAYCLIIWTSPEINFDVEFLWVSCLGPRQGGWGVEVAGQLRMWAKCVRHMQRYERAWERRSGCERGGKKPPPYIQLGVTHILQIGLIRIQPTWSCGLIELDWIHLSSLCDRPGPCLN